MQQQWWCHDDAKIKNKQEIKRGLLLGCYIVDRKGEDNQVDDHLSRMENIPDDPIPINDSFVNEQRKAVEDALANKAPTERAQENRGRRDREPAALAAPAPRQPRQPQPGEDLRNVIT